MVFGQPLRGASKTGSDLASTTTMIDRNYTTLFYTGKEQTADSIASLTNNGNKQSIPSQCGL
jgi:hypothetical protein